MDKPRNHRKTRKAFGACLTALFVAVSFTSAATPDDPLAPWRSGVKVQRVDGEAARHSIHSYFNTTPESPDGRWVLYYTSTTANGQHGEIRIRERATGTERVLVENLNTEDAHRAACQQWVAGGKTVAFHNERDGQWYVGAVDLADGKERVLAPDRLVCWGRPERNEVPIYGKHWKPGPHRDIELLDVTTGAIRTVLTADAVKAQFPDWWQQQVGDRPGSLFFPELSPDGQRVFCKIAASDGTGDPRSKGASSRDGLVCYDIGAQRFLTQRPRWGHPAWMPDSRKILEVGYQVIDAESGAVERLLGLPPMGSGHPSASPDGKLIVTDLIPPDPSGSRNVWAVVVGDRRGGSSVEIHRFDNSKGAKSWRVSHPHPVFSPDGKRIYFNVSSGQWTELWVAEAATAP